MNQNCCYTLRYHCSYSILLTSQFHDLIFNKSACVTNPRSCCIHWLSPHGIEPRMYISILTNQVEEDQLVIKSPHFLKPTLTGEKAADGRPELVPPNYEIEAYFSKTTNGGKTVLSRKHCRMVLGNFGTCTMY